MWLPAFLRGNDLNFLRNPPIPIQRIIKYTKTNKLARAAPSPPPLTPTTVYIPQHLLWGDIVEVFGVYVLKGKTKAAFRIFHHELVHLKNQQLESGSSFQPPKQTRACLQHRTYAAAQYQK